MAERRAIATGAGELRRFVLERHPVRGFWTRLDGPWRELCSHQHHSAPVERLLGEALTASVLLAATLKFQGTLRLQLQGAGLVRLLVAQCTHDLRFRAVARVEQPEPTELQVGFRELVGDDSRLVVTIESDEQAAYQSVVQLEGSDLATSLESYFATSEQLPTRIAIAADEAHASGVLVQKMPSASRQGEAQAALSQQAWEQVQSNLSELPRELLRAGSAEQALLRICGRHDGRLFAAAAVQFACRCSRERVAGLLRALGPEELQTVLAELGEVTVTCEFCGRPYRFDAIDVERLFAHGAAPQAPPSVN